MPSRATRRIVAPPAPAVQVARREIIDSGMHVGSLFLIVGVFSGELAAARIVAWCYDREGRAASIVVPLILVFAVLPLLRWWNVLGLLAIIEFLLAMAVFMWIEDNGWGPAIPWLVRLLVAAFVWGGSYVALLAIAWIASLLARRAVQEWLDTWHANLAVRLVAATGLMLALILAFFLVRMARDRVSGARDEAEELGEVREELEDHVIERVIETSGVLDAHQDTGDHHHDEGGHDGR